MLFAEWSSTLVRGTAWLCFAFYIATLYGWLTWHGQVKVYERLRFFWTLGFLIFLIHVVCAFHLVHRWSHQSAWDATQLQGGYGDGIYANYLVLIIWLLDVAWWWLSPQGYPQRSRWLHIAIHGFLLFMWFNAAVIFAHDELASMGIAGFTLLAVGVLQWYRRIKRASHPSQESPGQ